MLNLHYPKSSKNKEINRRNHDSDWANDRSNIWWFLSPRKSVLLPLPNPNSGKETRQRERWKATEVERVTISSRKAFRLGEDKTIPLINLHGGFKKPDQWEASKPLLFSISSPDWFKNCRLQPTAFRRYEKRVRRLNRCSFLNTLNVATSLYFFVLGIGVSLSLGGGCNGGKQDTLNVLELSFDVEELLRNDVGGLHPMEGGSGAYRRLPRWVWEATFTLQFNSVGLRFVGPHMSLGLSRPELTERPNGAS